MIVMIILIMSVGTVCATDDISDEIISDGGQDTLKISQNDIYTTGESSFSDLADEIRNASMTLDLTKDYTFNNETDNNTGILISNDNFVLNGNGFTIDGNKQSRIFNITANNVTLSNLVLINGNSDSGAAIRVNGTLTLNNITFINNHARDFGGAIAIYGNVTLICNNSKFIDNSAERGAIFIQNGELNLYNAYLTSKVFAKASQIYGHFDSSINIENTTFENIFSNYMPAVYLTSSKARIINSKFNNLKSAPSVG